MKKSNILSFVLAVVAIVAIVIGGINTSATLKAYKEYQEGIQSYNMFADAEDTIIGEYAAKLAAKAFSGSQTAKTIQKNLYKCFAISMVAFFVGGLCIAFAVMTFSKKKE